jgi:hypothetical protein
VIQKKKAPSESLTWGLNLAEMEGFEPSIHFWRMLP